MPSKQIARSAEPRQESHCRRSVEPGNVRAALESGMGRTGSAVMRAMKWQVPLERQMEVDRAGQKGKHTQREAHKETEKIEIRPGHKSPRARHLLSATCCCGARAGIRDTDLGARCTATPAGPAQLRSAEAGGGWPLPFRPPL